MASCHFFLVLMEPIFTWSDIDPEWVFSQIESYLQVRRFNSVYNAVVLILLRIGYTTILSMIAVKVRSSLAESRGVREGKNNHPLFIAICIVPLINNILYLGSDIPQLILSYRDITYSDMDRLNKFYADWRLFECRFIGQFSIHEL